MTKLKKRLFPLFILTFSVYLVYLQGFICRFLISDDYFLFYDINGASVYISSGRPLSYLITNIYREIYNRLGIQGAYIPRLISAVGLVVLGYVLHGLFIRYRFDRKIALFLSLLVINIPCFILYVLWISCNPNVYSALASTLGFVFTIKALQGNSKVRQYIYTGLATAFVVAGIATYQPSGMIYFALIALDLLLLRTKDLKRLAVTVGYKTAVGGVAMALYFVLYKVLLKILHQGANSRAEFPDDYLGKLKHFWTDVVILSSSFNHIYFNKTSIEIMLCILLGLLLIYPLLQRGRIKYHAARLAALPLIMMLAYAPNMLTKTNYPAFRTLLGPSVVFAIFFGLFYQILTRRLKPAWRYGVLLCLGIMLLMQSNYLATRTLIYPNAMELNYIVNTIEQKYVDMANKNIPVKTIYFIPTQDGYGIVDKEMCRFGEFGVNSTSQSWNSKYSVMLAMQILHLNPDHCNIVLSSPNDHFKITQDTLTVDMNAITYLQTIRGAKT